MRGSPVRSLWALIGILAGNLGAVALDLPVAIAAAGMVALVGVGGAAASARVSEQHKAMAVPDFQTFLQPVLARVAERRWRAPDLDRPHRRGLRAYSPEDRAAQLLPSGRQPVLANRVHWAITYLSAGGPAAPAARAASARSRTPAGASGRGAGGAGCGRAGAALPRRCRPSANAAATMAQPPPRAPAPARRLRRGRPDAGGPHRAGGRRDRAEGAAPSCANGCVSRRPRSSSGW